MTEEKQLYCTACGRSNLEKMTAKVYCCNDCTKVMVPSKKQIAQHKRVVAPTAQIVLDPSKIATVKNALPSEFVDGEFDKVLDEIYDKSICGVLVSHEELKDGTIEIHAGLTKDNRLSGIHAIVQWRKKNKFYGKFAMEEIAVLKNVIGALDKILSDFDEEFKEKSGKPVKTLSAVPIKTIIISNCPSCGKKLKRDPVKSMIYCEDCAEVFLIDKRMGDVICEMDPEEMALEYISDGYAGMMEYYKPVAGMTVDSRPLSHQAIVIVKHPRTLDRFLRLYQWTRRDIEAEWKAGGHNNIYKIDDVERLRQVLNTIMDVWKKIEQ
jgi:ribosomal protein L37AE/L43A